MKEFLIIHVDAIITTVAGLCFTVYSIRKRVDLAQSANKLRRALPIIAPVVLMCGLIQFFIGTNKPLKNGSSQTNSGTQWQTVATDDGVASVEFPVIPTRTETTDRAPGIEVRRVTFEAVLAGGALNYRLSYNELPLGSEPQSDEARVVAMKEGFVRAGYKVIDESEIQNGIAKLVVQDPKDGGRWSFRLGFLPKGIYRALVTSKSGYHDDQQINRFLNSFTMKKQPAEAADGKTPEAPQPPK